MMLETSTENWKYKKLHKQVGQLIIIYLILLYLDVKMYVTKTETIPEKYELTEIQHDIQEDIYTQTKKIIYS